MRPTLDHVRPRSTRLLVASLALSTALVTTGSLSGCADADAAAREDVSTLVSAQSRALREANVRVAAFGEPGFDTRRGQLEQIATQLRNVQGGSPGQQAAASMLSSAANRELAKMALAEANALESENANRRAQLVGQINAASMIASTIRGLRDIDAAGEARALDSVRQRATEALQQSSTRMAELDDPIAELTRSRQQAQQRAQQLREDANRLLREASQTGYIAGLSTYQEGMQIRRQADVLDFRAVQADIELGYEYQPQHRLASEAASQAQATIEQIDRSKRDLNELHNRIQAAIREAESNLNQSLQQISSIYGSIAQLRDGALADAYGRAISHAEQAEGQAQTAISRLGRDADAARMAKAVAAQVKAQAYIDQAKSVELELALLQRLADSDAMADAQPFQAALNAAEEQRGSLRQLAITALQEARQSAAGITGAGAATAIQGLTRSIDQLVVSLGGQATAPPPGMNNDAMSPGGMPGPGGDG